MNSPSMSAGQPAPFLFNRRLQKNSMPLWMGSVSLIVLFVFLGYIFTKKPNLEIIPDKKKYEQQFEEEYRQKAIQIFIKIDNLNNKGQSELLEKGMKQT